MCGLVHIYVRKACCCGNGNPYTDTMIRYSTFFTLLILILTACQTQAPAQTVPTDIPFPTMTAGSAFTGNLPSNDILISDAQLANPATIEANAARPSPTPNLRSCPAQSGGLSLAVLPESAADANDAIANFLTLGGTLTDLEDQLLNDWDVLGDDGFIRSDTDMTGEGMPDVIVSYTGPTDLGVLGIFTCSNGEYIPRYQIVSEGTAPPNLTWLGDINRNGLNDLVYSALSCDEDETCEYATQVVTWERDRGRFVNLVDGRITSFTIPTLNDIDNDDVAEIVVTLDNRGTSATGPLRTGINIYDWNGSVYTLSIIQLDSPRYRIQLVHQADRLFGRLQPEQAVDLYLQAIDEEEELGYWFNNGEAVVTAYVLYRLILTHSYSGDFEARETVVNALEETYPIEENTDPANFPVYIEMAYAFLSGWEATNNLSNACALVQGVIENRPEALDLLNRYGSRSPQYTESDLCPF